MASACSGTKNKPRTFVYNFNKKIDSGTTVS
jgi:hypothetical protein